MSHQDRLRCQSRPAADDAVPNHLRYRPWLPQMPSLTTSDAVPNHLRCRPWPTEKPHQDRLRCHSRPAADDAVPDRPRCRPWPTEMPHQDRLRCHSRPAADDAEPDRPRCRQRSLAITFSGLQYRPGTLAISSMTAFDAVLSLLRCRPQPLVRQSLAARTAVPAAVSDVVRPIGQEQHPWTWMPSHKSVRVTK